MRQVAEQLCEEGLPFPYLPQDDDDTPGLVILCKIAHTWERRRCMSNQGKVSGEHSGSLRSENLRSDTPPFGEK
jgi:hypothetical protein